MSAEKDREIEQLRARVRSLEISHAEVSAIALEAVATNSRLGRAVLRGISALSCLPPDEGPIRRQAGAAIAEMRSALETVGELH